jgi:hypothetical protein
MSTEQPGTPPGGETEWERRKRLAAVFGDTLPETTRDERDDEAPAVEDRSEAWLRAQVPPHHGGH